MSGGYGWTAVLLVGAGGAIGSLLRYAAGRLAARAGAAPRLATWAVNASGSLAVGLTAALEWETAHPLLYAGVAAGLLGGLTTYSTLNVQKAQLRTGGERKALAGYVAATYACGWAAFAAGFALGRLLGG